MVKKALIWHNQRHATMSTMRKHHTSTQDRRTLAGSQRYKCQACQHRYTPEPKHHGHPEEVRRRAVQVYLDGMNFRRIGRLLGVYHTSVMSWINAYAAVVDEAPVPEQVATAELDEVFTFSRSK